MSTSNPEFCRAVAEALGKTYDADGFFTWVVETKIGPARVAVTLDDDIHVTFLRSAFSEEEQALVDSLCIDTSKAIAWTIRRSETSPHLGLAMDLAMIQRMTHRLETVGWEKPVRQSDSRNIAEGICNAFVPVFAEAGITYTPGNSVDFIKGMIDGHVSRKTNALVKALEGLLARYVGLVESGDAGSWDAEAEPCVIDARAVLKLAKG